jgi:predicted phosphodiesterase
LKEKRLDEAQSKKRMKKVLVICDTHAPKHDRRVVDCELQYAEDYKPDMIVHLGDVGHFESVSHWIADKRLKLEGLRVKSDIESAVDILNKFKATAPKAELVVTMGNHDAWCQQYVDVHAELKGLVDIDAEYKKAGYKVIPLNKPYAIGKLLVGHGWFISKYHAYQTVHAFSKSVMYGHTHDRQEITESFYDGEKSGQSIGCSCDLNPDYLKNRPKRWVHGFATVDVDTITGDFYSDFIKIIKGRFVRNGKIYDGK